MKKLALLLAITMAAAWPAAAGDTGILKLSLWGDIAIAAPTNNLDHVTGLELGIGSDTNKLTGVQFDWLYAKSNNATGVQGAIVTHSKNLTGVEFGFVNISERNVTGVQWGFFNQAESLTGVQLGFVNNVKNIHGLQLGLVNFAKNGWFPVMVFVNGRF